MPTVQITDEKKYAKATGLLIRMGGIFRTKPYMQFVIGPAQLHALKQAGLVPKEPAPKENGAKKRGKKPT